MHKHLLIVTTGYPNRDGSNPRCTFVKDYVDAIKNKFDTVNVIAPTPFFPNRLGNILTKFQTYIGLKNYKYDNVQVHYPKYFTLPVGFFAKNNHKKFLNVLFSCLSENNITPDIIHAHFTIPSGWAAMQLSQKIDKQYILTIHENSLWFQKEYASGDDKIYNTWRNAAAIVRVNKQDILKLKEYNTNTVYIPNGYDTEKFYPMDQEECRKKLGIPLDKKVLLNVASHKLWHKNQDGLIRAFAEVQKQHKDLMLYLVGAGPDADKIKKLIYEKNLQDRVILAGSQPHNMIPVRMNATDWFVLPSHHEGNPTVLFETMATGTYYVGSAVGGVRDIVQSKSLGYIYDDSSSDIQLINAMKYVITNIRGKDKNVQEYGKGFTWSAIATQTYDVMKNV